MKAKVTVIVPVYNVEHLLARCLDSIVNQTLKEIEIICVDDKSPDNSLAILRQYEAREPRLKVICHSQNKRQGGARNTALEMATGEYVGFVDSDDYLDLDYYEKLYNAASAADADISCCGIIKHKPHSKKYVARYEACSEFTSMEEKFRICNCPPDFHPVNKLYRREMLCRNSLRFEEKRMFEDIDFVSKAICYANKIVTVPDTYYRYILNMASTVKGKETPQKQYDRYITRKRFVEFASTVGLDIPQNYRHIPVKSYNLYGITILKVKEYNGYRSWRLFDFIPVWREKPEP